MKIEKINDNQIRCTLTKEDLEDRKIKLTELAYGTDKARNLFKDMMQKAAFEVGFEAENTPLMIEAIPISSDSITLIITKVNDPDELDARFSRFAPDVLDEEEFDAESELVPVPETLDVFGQVKDDEEDEDRNTMRIYDFAGFHDITEALKSIDTPEIFSSSLYKDEKTGALRLVVKRNKSSKEQFAKLCNTLSEYGALSDILELKHKFLEEHQKPLIAEAAIEKLKML